MARFKFQLFLFSDVFLCLAFLPFTSLQETKQIDGQQPTIHEEFNDWVAVQTSSLVNSQALIARVKYRTKAARLALLEIFSYGHNLEERKELGYSFTIPIKTENTRERNIHVQLRDSLVFRESISLNMVTDLHTDRLKIVISLLSIENLTPNIKADVYATAYLFLKLVPPWNRPLKPGFSFNCFVNFLERAKDLNIPKCRRVRDVVTFVDFPVALTGKEEGYTKKLYPIDWHDEYLNEIQGSAKPRFTIATWVYVLEPCAKELCSIIQHRSDKFLTPLVSLVPSGQFHVQLHFQDGSGQAFLTRGGIHRNTWNQVVLTFDDTAVTVTVKHGEKLENEEIYEYHEFTKGSYYIDDSDGYWIIGGTNGFSSFKGFVGPTTLYRRRALPASQVPLPPRNHTMFTVELQSYFRVCQNVVNGIATKIEELAIDKRINESLVDLKIERCPAKFIRYHDLYNYNMNEPRICDVPFTGASPEVDKIVEELLNKDGINVSSAGEQIFAIASKLLQRSVHAAPLVLNLLHISSCIGYSKAIYTAGIMHATGLGVPQTLNKAWQLLLAGAILDHPLSQMSLAYRFLIGGDGFPRQCDIAAGYYKMAALTTDRVTQEHQLVHTHSEAIRIDDYDEVASHKGKDSDIFQWLAHQAWQGIGEAQGMLGDIYWFGKKGFNRDLNEAIKFYKMNAELGKPEGLFNLGISKLKGQGTEKNVTEAIELINKAAEQGFPAALNALGFIETNFRSNSSGAVMYFKQAADKGDRDGLNNLGIAIANGWDDVQPDKAKAIEYWKKAAGKGHPGACIATGEEMRIGYYTEHDCATAVVFLRYVAEQHPEVGWLLRKGLQSYNGQHLYKSLLSYIFAGETGMEVPQYNAALLCEENEKELQNVTSIDCAMRYFNNSAALGWVYSMMKVGDYFWYGKSVEHNLKSAATMYAEAASKNDHPHAVYNLAYMVEYNYSLAGITWRNIDKGSIMQGNLTFAAVLYQRCRDSKENGNESYFPCAFGLARVLMKAFYRTNTVQVQVMATVSTVMAVLLSVWFVKVGDRLE